MTVRLTRIHHPFYNARVKHGILGFDTIFIHLCSATPHLSCARFFTSRCKRHKSKTQTQSLLSKKLWPDKCRVSYFYLVRVEVHIGHMGEGTGNSFPNSSKDKGKRIHLRPNTIQYSWAVEDEVGVKKHKLEREAGLRLWKKELGKTIIWLDLHFRWTF